MKKFIVVVVLGLLLGFQSVSHAIPTISFTDGIQGTGYVVDQGSYDNNPVVGIVGFTGKWGTLGTWQMNITSGITYPFMGSPAEAYMDLLSWNSSSGAGTLTIQFSEVGFTQPGNGIFSAGGTISAGTVSFNAWSDSGNSLFERSKLIASVGPFSSPGDFGSGSGTILGGPYSLTIESILTFPDGGGDTSYDARFTVPEPASLLLLGLGLFGLGIVLRKKKKK